MSTSKLNEPAMTLDPVLISTIRKVMPSVIAEDIVGVQSMTNGRMPFPIQKWEKIGMDMPTNKWVFNIRSQEIRDWIEEQPIHMWKFYDINDVKLEYSLSSLGQNYVFTEEMEAWFTLRWS